MKKFFICAACALSALAASAQQGGGTSPFFSSERPEQTVTFGVRGGYNFSRLLDFDRMLERGKSGYNAGLDVDFSLTKSFGVKTGVFFINKGYKYIDDDGRGKEETKLNLHYLEIPVLASYRYPVSENVRLDVNFGPYFAVALAGKSSTEERGQKFETSKLFEKGGYKRFDCGLALGAGVTVSKIYLGFQYDFGLMDILKESDGDFEKNRSLSISVGYNF